MKKHVLLTALCFVPLASISVSCDGDSNRSGTSSNEDMSLAESKYENGIWTVRCKNGNPDETYTDAAFGDAVKTNSLCTLPFMKYCKGEYGDLPAARVQALRTTMNALLMGDSCEEALDDIKQNKYVSIRQPEVTDLSPLRGLDLEYLSIEGTQVSDLQPLSGMTNMRRLILNSNQIEDITAVKNMSKLNEIAINKNRIRDISALTGLKELVRIEARNNQIEKIFDLSSSNELFYIFLENNLVSDISPIKQWPKAGWLNVEGNRLESISDLSGTNLADLYIGQNPIKSISGLAGANINFLWWNASPGTKVDLKPLSAATIQSLHIFNVDIRNEDLMQLPASIQRMTIRMPNVTDPSGLSHLKDKLHSLHIDKSATSDFSILREFGKLQTLKINDAPVRDVAFLSSLSLLEELDLQQTQVVDIAPVASLQNLKSIKMDRTPLTRVDALASLPNLQNIGLSDTMVSDLNPLGGFKKLRSLFIGGSQVKDLSPLAGLQSLDYFGAYNIPLGTTVVKTAENCPRDASIAPKIKEFCSSR